MELLEVQEEGLRLVKDLLWEEEDLGPLWPDLSVQV